MNLYTRKHASFALVLWFTIRAHKLFTKDKDYIIRVEKMVLSDKGAKGVMGKSKLQEEVHQAIEKPRNMSNYLLRRGLWPLTYLRVFLMFNKRYLVTGTGKVAEKEFIETYTICL